MNPFLQLQEDTAARLALHATLGRVPMVTESLGNVTSRISEALVKGALKPDQSGKAGLAILIITPKGRGNQNSRIASSQIVTVRVAIFVRPIINDSAAGLQIHPLEALFASHAQVLSWQRGGTTGPNFQHTLDQWDSRENANGELSYFSDFSIPTALTF